MLDLTFAQNFLGSVIYYTEQKKKKKVYSWYNMGKHCDDDLHVSLYHAILALLKSLGFCCRNGDSTSP